MIYNTDFYNIFNTVISFLNYRSNTKYYSYRLNGHNFWWKIFFKILNVAGKGWGNEFFQLVISFPFGNFEWNIDFKISQYLYYCNLFLYIFFGVANFLINTQPEFCRNNVSCDAWPVIIQLLSPSPPRFHELA